MPRYLSDDGIRWEVLEGEDGIGLIIGTTSDGRGVTYCVDPKGELEVDESQTDGDYDGEGWPNPPEGLVQEARQLAMGSMAN